MEDSRGCKGELVPSSNGSMQSSGFKETDNPGEDLLDDIDSYFEDINERLTISRMVSDSVVKGMVNAIREEAMEKMDLKDLEVASLKERLHFYESGAYKVEELEFPNISASLMRQDSAEDCFGDLRMSSEKQFHTLKEKIEDIKACRLPQGQSKVKESEKWAGVDQTLGTLKNILNSVWTDVNSIVYSSKKSLFDWKRDREFQDEVEAMVIQNSIRGIHDEYEVRLWDQRTQFHGSQSTNQLEKINQLYDLRQELNSINKTLSNFEMAQLALNGSHEGSEESNIPKRKDHFLRKAFSMDSNGDRGECGITMPKIMDDIQLKHMSKDELINYFKGEMTRDKRSLESRLHEKTEEYFSLRRDYLRETGPLSTLRRDKEFEAFRKKIPEVIVKLDNMFLENERLPAVYENNEIICSLKNRVDSLLSENHQMKDLLANKSREAKCLASQVSNAADNMLHHSLAEAKLLKQIRKLKCEIEDTRIEVSIREDVYKCFVKEYIDKTKLAIEDSEMESLATLETYEIICREIAIDAKGKCDIEDFDMESIIMQEISGIIFREAAKGAGVTLSLMKSNYEEEKERRVSLEASILGSEKFLSLEIEEKEHLKQDIIRLSAMIAEKEKLALEKESLWMKEKEHCDLIDRKLNLVRSQLSQKENEVSESRSESNMTKHKLEEALGQIQFYEEEIINQGQKLLLAIEDSKRANEEIKMLNGIIQEKETALLLDGEKESKEKKQTAYIQASIQSFCEASADFEARTLDAVEKNNLRLRRLKTQLDPFIQNAIASRRMELVYKQRLERRSCDLQKAETEVDLLGDEVDTLLSLLEKIYIALYHYSHVLQHYPGIMEILKLIKRELSVETAYSHKKC